MNFIQFRERMEVLFCFSTDQVQLCFPGFHPDNFTRWVKKGLLVRLRNGWYTFPHLLRQPGAAHYFANRIYRPSYVSLQSALAFYGAIPEGVVQVTSVTTLKTSFFVNDSGEYTYRNIKKELMFGYRPLPFGDGRTILMATPEKALLDFLYLYPEYQSAGDMEQLRLDEDFLRSTLKDKVLEDFLSGMGNRALKKRWLLLRNSYDL